MAQGKACKNYTPHLRTMLLRDQIHELEKAIVEAILAIAF